MSNCYCGNSLSFQECCEPYILGFKNVSTAEALMRSRYSAYVVAEADYLLATTHVSTRKSYKKSDILQWSQANKWLKLEIIASTENTVTFKAFYLDENLKVQVHYEHSNFKLENKKWFYVDGTFN